MNYIRTGLSNARQELKSPMFDLSEPSSSSENLLEASTAPSLLDMVKTFSPSPHYVTIPAKLVILAWALSLLGMSITEYSIQSFWLAYLTNWGWTVSCAYFLCSTLTAVFLIKFGVDDKASRLLVKITWALFAIILPGEIAIMGLYWIFIGGGTSYIDIMAHGGGILLILIDGFIINRTPLRIKQFALYEAFSIAYIGWSLIFSYSDLTNPYQETGYQDDDALYPTLRWKTNTASTIVLCVILLVVVNPVVFLMCRWVSRMMPMRLVTVEEKSGDVELAKTGQ